MEINDNVKDTFKKVLNEMIEKVNKNNNISKKSLKSPLHFLKMNNKFSKGPPKGPPPFLKNNNNKNEHLYLSDKDIQDEISVNVPEKYINDYKIIDDDENNNLLIKFFQNYERIRQHNLSLRQVTLNKFMILKIEKKGRYCDIVDLHLNLGLNPYINFNDYYPHIVNFVHIELPIFVFKRYVKYDPYCDINLTIKKNTIIEIKVKYFTEEGMELMRKKFNADIYSNYDPEKVIIIYNYNLEKVKNNSNILKSNKTTFDYPISNDYKINVTNNGISDWENKKENKGIWRYGIESLKKNKINTNQSTPLPNGFDWYFEIHKEYDLVKSYKRIEDFNKIMIIDGYDENDEEEMKYRDTFYDIGYFETRDKLISKMVLLSTSSKCIEDDYDLEDIVNAKDNTCEKNINLKMIEKWKKRNQSMHLINKKIKIKKSKLTEILFNYIENVQKYIFEGDDINIRKYIRKEELFEKVYNNENLYAELLNDGLFKLLEKGLEEYEKDTINNEQYELQTPDIYILLGFHEFPSKFCREFWNSYEFAQEYKWKWMISSFAFLESTGWYYMYGLCCFFAQVIGPSYYVYNYYLIEKNEYCPNNSLVLNKCFAIAYYLVLYARMNSFWRSLTNTVWQYGNTSVITNDNYLRLTLIINSVCLYIVPLFTYTLFIELSNVTDLILNCLTGEFLINIDNLIIEFIGEEDYIKTITKELLTLSFIEKGFPTKNIMEGNTPELWLISALQVIQMFGTLVITFFVYKCI
tara:strand:- start:23 stop:2269 length:2247 start_codon:yes stop_codon:yes gene_type:complete